MSTPLAKLVSQVPLMTDPKVYHGHRSSVGLPRQGETTKSFWLHKTENPLAREGANTSFASDDVDVVVIGSGITGVSAVHHLVQGMKNAPPNATKKQLSIVMLEARDFCSGATGRNGGHFITLPYDGFRARSAKTSPSSEEDEGVMAAKLEMDTIAKLRSIIAFHGWETDVNLGSNGHTRLFFTEEEEEEDVLEYNAAEKAGVPWDGITRLSKSQMIETYGTAYPGVSIPAGSIWALKLVTKLFQLASSEAPGASVSLKLHTHTPAEAIERVTPDTSQRQTSARWVIQTPSGALKARFIIHATNAWASHLLPQYSRPDDDDNASHTFGDQPSTPRCGRWIAPFRGQMIATRANVPPSKLPQRAFASDWMEDYWLPKPVHGPPDDSENALVLLGGGRDSEGDDTELGVADDTTLNPRLSKSLRAILPKAFPQFFDENQEPEMEWTGIQAFTDSEDPIVGPVPVRTGEDIGYLPGQYISAGYMGHGMSRAFSCAEAVVEMIFAEMRHEKPVRPGWLPRSFSTLSTRE